ncbi:hypothetical protein DRJ48_05275 [Candidatus Woesearchaeota archaeon]|nr:MAG: hypothetical protein DRJ48_05275 [Candidatus Woesearchaeota archaeon]
MNKKGLFGLMGYGTSSNIRTIGIVFAFVLLIVGLVPLLNRFNVINFQIPDIPSMILNVIIVIGGLLLLIESFRR